MVQRHGLKSYRITIPYWPIILLAICTRSSYYRSLYFASTLFPSTPPPHLSVYSLFRFQKSFHAIALPFQSKASQPSKQYIKAKIAIESITLISTLIAFDLTIQLIVQNPWTLYFRDMPWSAMSPLALTFASTALLACPKTSSLTYTALGLFV